MKVTKATKGKTNKGKAIKVKSEDEQIEESMNAILKNLISRGIVPWRPFITITRRPGYCYYTEGHVVAVYQEKDGSWCAFTGPDPEEAKKPKKKRVKVPPSPGVMRAFHLTSEDEAKAVAMYFRLMVDNPISERNRGIVKSE